MARLLSLSLLLFLFSAAARADEGHAHHGSGPATTTSESESGGTTEPPVGDTGRPTSGTLSILSGRTLGIGRTTVAFGAGWPGAFAQLDLAPSSTFNLAFRGTFLYGAPMVGVNAGLGADLLVSARLHLYGRGTFDFSLTARLGGTVGQASLTAQSFPSPYVNELGWGARGDVGGLAGFQVSDSVTLTLGLLLGSGAAHTPSAGSHSLEGFFTFVAVFGVEVATSEDMLLFLDVEGGVDMTDGGPFGSQAIIRAYAGVAFAP